MSTFAALHAASNKVKKANGSGKSGAKKSGKGKGKKEQGFHVPQRNVLHEGRQALKLMGEAYPKLLTLQQRYGSAFAKSETDIASARLGAETDAINTNYPGFREAMLRSPEVAEANSAMRNRLGETGPSAIEKRLVQQAGDDLALGGELSDDELRNVQQGSRAAASARGLSTGSTSALAEVLSRDGAVRQRLRERQGFASGVDAQVQSRKASDASITANIGQAQMAYWDPQSRMFGKGGGSASLGAVNPTGSFAPFLNAAGDVGRTNQEATLNYQMHKENLAWDKDAFSQNQDFSRWATEYNAGMSSANAKAQSKSNMTGSIIGTVGMIAAAFL